MTQFTDEQIEEAFDEYGLSANMVLGQYKEIVEHMGELIDPSDYSYCDLDDYAGSSAEEKLANYWLDDFPINTGFEDLDRFIEANIDLEGLGSDLATNGIFVSYNGHDGYFQA